MFPACKSGAVLTPLLPRPGPADVAAAARRGAAHVARHVDGGVRQAQHPAALAHAQRVRLAAAEEVVGNSDGRGLFAGVDRSTLVDLL